MKQIDLLLPFALPHDPLAKDLLREIKAPALATLISRARASKRIEQQDFARALPHERWLAERFGLAGPGCPAASLPLMRQHRMQADAGLWFVLQPVHFHIARDHLVLTDADALVINEAESRELFGIAQALFAEAGIEIRYGDPRCWFLRCDAWTSLSTSTPAAAAGHNIDLWSPSGDGERAWRKAHNDVQMHWHEHPVNQAREQRGLRPINALWLWGASPAALQLPAPPYGAALNLPGWAAALGALCPVHGPATDAGKLVSASSDRAILALNNLIEPALAEDWGDWLSQLHALDETWFAPLAAALKTRKIGQLRLLMTHNNALQEFSIGRMSLYQFWTRPSLARLAP